MFSLPFTEPHLEGSVCISLGRPTYLCSLLVCAVTKWSYIPHHKWNAAIIKLHTNEEIIWLTKKEIAQLDTALSLSSVKLQGSNIDYLMHQSSDILSAVLQKSHYLGALNSGYWALCAMSPPPLLFDSSPTLFGLGVFGHSKTYKYKIIYFPKK